MFLHDMWDHYDVSIHTCVTDDNIWYVRQCVHCSTIYEYTKYPHNYGVAVHYAKKQKNQKRSRQQRDTVGRVVLSSSHKKKRNVASFKVPYSRPGPPV